MAFEIVFASCHRYDSQEPGIELPVLLDTGSAATDVVAFVDTGASICIFQRRVAELLRINVESGLRAAVSTVTRRFAVFGHVVNLSVLDHKFETTVYFAEDAFMRRNVLGRIGWLDTRRRNCPPRQPPLPRRLRLPRNHPPPVELACAIA
ncbi:MAG: hypothetical protein U0Q16_32285 [Bryobacteraceae bacterium]